MYKPLIIGVAGGTGSGKTTLSQKIRDHYRNQVIYIPHDNYYRDQSHLTMEDRKKTNYDHPNALETELLIRHLKELLKGSTFTMPIYDFTRHTRSQETAKVKPKKIIIIEGILVFENKSLRDLMDIKIFVDTDADIRLARRIKRDMEERKRTFDFVMYQYLTMAKPMHEAFVEPSKKFADIIVPEGGHNKIALRMIIQGINKFQETKRDG